MTSSRFDYALAILFLCFSFSSLAAADNWPQFRGPTGQGQVTTTGLPVSWSEKENVTWRTSLPGRGWSSPVIEDGQVWLTTAIDTPAAEQDRKKRLEANTGGQPLIVSESVTFRAVCVDLASGKQLHDVELMTQKDPQWIHNQNSYATPTPIIENDMLYCHFGTHGTACLDTNRREVVWTNRDLRIMHENGPGSTPVLWRDVIIFHCDGSDQQFVVGLDKRTGKVAWKTKRSGKLSGNPQLRKAYATPLVVDVDGRPQLISPGAFWLYGYNPITGKELWKMPYGVNGFSNVPRPIAGHGMVYISTSFMQPHLLAVRCDGKPGDDQPYVAWRFKKQVPNVSSPVMAGDQLYMVSDKGIATCLDARSGTVHWTKRLGGNYSASPIHADGRIYFFSRDGETSVIKVDAKYQLLATNKLEGSFMASAAAVDGAFILRTDKALYRIESPR